MCKMALFISHVSFLSSAGRTLGMPCLRCLFSSVFYLLYPINKRVLWTDFEIEFKNSAVFETTLMLSYQLREENKPRAPHRASQCLVQRRHRTEAQGQRLRPRIVARRRWGSCVLRVTATALPVFSFCSSHLQCCYFPLLPSNYCQLKFLGILPFSCPAF